MTVSTDEGLAVGFSVEPEAVLAFELDAADADATAIPVYYLAFCIADADKEVIEIRLFGTSELRCLQGDFISGGDCFSRLHPEVGAYQSCCMSIGLLQFIFDDSLEGLVAFIAYLCL